MTDNKPTIGEVYNQYFKKLPDTKSEIVLRLLINKVNHYTSMSDFFLHRNDPILSLEEFKKYFDEYLKGKPVEYITNEAYFDGDIYYVKEGVLIPRPETEEVVHNVSELIKEFNYNYKAYDVIDVCTGTGVIGIALSKYVPMNKLTLIDISKSALEVAKVNVEKFSHRLPKKTIIKEQDVLSNMFYFTKEGGTIITANPPYIIDKSTVDESVLKYEPHQALFTTNALEVYVAIMLKAKAIKKDCLIVFEISDEICDRVVKYMIDIFPLCKYKIIKDINGKNRTLGIMVNA